MAACKSCGAEIHFVKTSGGKFMPCESQDYFWDELENGVMAIGEDGVLRTKSPTTEKETHRVRFYIPHWSRCPGAARHRSKE